MDFSEYADLYEYYIKSGLAWQLASELILHEIKKDLVSNRVNVSASKNMF